MTETILSLEQAAMERWRNGDPWGWAEISAAEITYVDPGLTQPIFGIEAYKAYLKQIEGSIFYQGSEFIDPKVVVVGDAAILTYNYRSTVTGPEATVAAKSCGMRPRSISGWPDSGGSPIPSGPTSSISSRREWRSPFRCNCRIRNLRECWARSWRSNPQRWSDGAKATPGASSRSAHRTSRTSTPAHPNG